MRASAGRIDDLRAKARAETRDHFPGDADSAVASTLTPTPAPRYAHVVAQDDGDELLRLMILAALARADGPLTAEQLAQRLAAMIGVRLIPERGH